MSKLGGDRRVRILQKYRVVAFDLWRDLPILFFYKYLITILQKYKVAQVVVEGTCAITTEFDEIWIHGQ